MRFFGGKVSTGVAVGLVVAAILIGLRALPADQFVFVAPHTDRPWTAITFPFGAGIVVALIFAIGIASLGSAIERDIGPAKTAVFYLSVTGLSALATQIGSMALGTPASLSGPWMLSAALSVAYGTRFPHTQVSLMGIAMIEARWLAWGSLILTLAAVVPMTVAVFTALALLFPWAFASGRIPFFAYGQPLAHLKRRRTTGRGVQTPRPDYFDDVKRREKEREERERLRKLFEGSGPDEPR